MFTRRLQVRFKDCDPAGIVFYPRYFEMINDTAEDFFAQVLDYPFHRMTPENGVPTVAIETQFLAPSRHGDWLEISFEVQTLGRTSLTYRQVAQSAGQDRFHAQATLVHVNREGRPTPWPETVTTKIKMQ